jgi:anti-anti-sigma factor
LEISHTRAEGHTRVVATGRLDGTWSDHLAKALDELVRAGHDQIVLDMSGIVFVSSLGLRCLLTAYKRLKAVGGSFSVEQPTDAVREVLEMAGMAGMLLAAAAASATSTPVAADPAPTVESFTRPAVRGELYRHGAQGMRGRAYGNPALLANAAFTASHNQTLEVRPDLLAIGLGAFGEHYAECAARYGEFLAVAGAAAYQPGDGSRTCDTLVTEGSYVPQVQSLYGLACTGNFTQLARFEPAEGAEQVSIGALAELVLELAGADLACLVIAGESAGLAGASLRRSPTAGTNDTAGAPLGFPEVRQWLSFTTEKAHVRASAVVCGVVAKAGTVPAALAPFLRPLGAGCAVEGHLHAAAFRFRALPRGDLTVAAALRPWFEHDTVEDVLHLLADDREPDATLESAFTRGALWVAPLTLETSP